MTTPTPEQMPSRKKREGFDMDKLVNEITARLRNEDEIVTIPGERGPQGPEGPAGRNGKSAIELWWENGGSGDEREYLNALVGERGPQGPKGDKGDSVTGPRGFEGDTGKSAYDIAVSYGYEGSEQDWLESIKGPPGQNGVDGESIKGDQGTPGSAGKSAFDLAKEQGFNGTISEWIASLKGAKGDTGSASVIPGPKGDKGDAGSSAQVWFNGTLKPDTKIFVATATTDINGRFTISLSAAGFTEVFSASVVPVASDSTAAGQATANVLSLSTTSLTGTVTKGISIVLGGLGIALVGSGRTVHATVFGR